MWPGIDWPARDVSQRGMRLWPKPGSSRDRSVSARTLGGTPTWMGERQRHIGPKWAKTAHCARVSVGVFAPFQRIALVYRWWTGGALRGLGDDDWRVSVRYTLGPTIVGPLKSPRVPEKAAQGAPWTLCIIDAWGVRPKAGHGRSEAGLALNGGSGNRRRGTRRRAAAAAIERTALRSVLREAVPGDVQAGSAGAPARVPRAMRAAAGAAMRSMVQRRVTRTRNATAIGERGAKRARGCGGRGSGVRTRKRVAPPPERRRGPRCAAVRPRRAGRGCRAAAPCRRGSR